MMKESWRLTIPGSGAALSSALEQLYLPRPRRLWLALLSGLDFVGAIIAMKKAGEVATACLGLQTLTYCVANCETGGSVLRTVSCMET